ncbi:hypothetical protein CASFOL_028470 [Castilleja foliolosa]|uniref:Uncharacterized protein n=1 Tax=Castilleja foliolosa TaxID=1961234 RepID=A0ABD3CEH9_9LAMI
MANFAAIASKWPHYASFLNIGIHRHRVSKNFPQKSSNSVRKDPAQYCGEYGLSQQ